MFVAIALWLGFVVAVCCWCLFRLLFLAMGFVWGSFVLLDLVFFVCW